MRFMNSNYKYLNFHITTFFFLRKYCSFNASSICHSLFYLQHFYRFSMHLRQKLKSTMPSILSDFGFTYVHHTKQFTLLYNER